MHRTSSCALVAFHRTARAACVLTLLALTACGSAGARLTALTPEDKVRISAELSTLEQHCNYMVINYTRSAAREQVSVQGRSQQVGIDYETFFVEGNSLEGTIRKANGQADDYPRHVALPALPWPSLVDALERVGRRFYMFKFEKNDGWVFYAHRREEGSRAGHGLRADSKSLQEVINQINAHMDGLEAQAGE